MEDAEGRGWKSRDVAMAVVGGIIVDATLEADLKSDHALMKDLSDFGMKYADVTSGQSSRYNRDNVRYVASGIAAVLGPYFVSSAAKVGGAVAPSNSELKHRPCN
jgi:hypothetical protein